MNSEDFDKQQKDNDQGVTPPQPQRDNPVPDEPQSEELQSEVPSVSQPKQPKERQEPSQAPEPPSSVPSTPAPSIPESPQVPEAPQQETPQPPQAPQPETSQPVQSPGTPQQDQKTDQMSPQQPQMQEQQSYQQNFQTSDQQYSSDSSDGYSGYVDGLMSALKAPQRLINGLSESIVKALIFIAVNVAVYWGINFVYIFAWIMKYNADVKDNDYKFKFTGEFWGLIFKQVGLTTLYSVGFLFLVAAVILVISMMMKRQGDFSKAFGLVSVFSLNFIAGAVATVFAFLPLFIDDLYKLVTLVNATIVSIVFVYTLVLVIQAIVKNIGLSYIVAVASIVATMLFGIFILSEMIDDFKGYFNVDFGYYTVGSDSLLEIADFGLKNSIDNVFDDYEIDFDY